MLSPHVVDLITHYFDQSAAQGVPGTLVGMLWYVDSRDKTIPVADEVNEALRLRPEIFVNRDTGLVAFSSAGDREVTADDLTKALVQYQIEFQAALAASRRDA